jgi:uncharacterized RDD family membrane protein YckC
MSTQASELSASFHDIVVPSFSGYAEPSALEGVSFWPRVAARLIDHVVHFSLRRVTGYSFGIMLLVASGGPGHVPRSILLRLRHPGITDFLFAILGYLAYHVIFSAVHGSSLGKRMLGMVVLQEDGPPCRFKGALIRELGYYVDGLFFGIIGYTAMQGSVQQQRHGDEWAQTVVCKRNQVVPEKLQGWGRFAVALVFACAADAALGLISLLLIIAT